MRRFSSAGIVLRTQELGEADLIVTLLARDLGKLQAAAKNARKSKQRFPGGIDLFDCTRFQLEEPRSGSALFTLHGAGEKVVWAALRSSLHKFAAASYLAELTDAAVMEASPEGGDLFQLLFHTFSALHTSQRIDEARMLLAYYTLQLLLRGGWGVPAAARDPAVVEWLQQMVRKEAPILPHDPQLAGRGLAALLGAAEEVVGRRLRTTESLIGAGLT